MMRDDRAAIYSDSDGVIADFHAGARKVLGRNFDNKTRAEDGARVNAVLNFWDTLPPMPDLELYWALIRKYDPHILTAVPSYPWEFDWQQVDRGKRLWYRKHLPQIPQRNIHIVERQDKRKYARQGSVRNILIDDHKQNTDEFEAAGGIGVHHVSARVTILKLKEIGYY